MKIVCTALKSYQFVNFSNCLSSYLQDEMSFAVKGI